MFWGERWDSPDAEILGGVWVLNLSPSGWGLGIPLLCLYLQFNRWHSSSCLLGYQKGKGSFSNGYFWTISDLLQLLHPPWAQENLGFMEIQKQGSKNMLEILFFTPALDHGALWMLREDSSSQKFSFQGVFHLPRNSRMILGLSNSGHSEHIPAGTPHVGEFCIYFSGINQVFWVCLWLLWVDNVMPPQPTDENPGVRSWRY